MRDDLRFGRIFLQDTILGVFPGYICSLSALYSRRPATYPNDVSPRLGQT